MDARRRRLLAASCSVASNSLLVIAKAVVGLLTGAVSVLSEALHSGVDLLAAVIALFAVRTADRPPDKGHPFGHGKAENISGFVEAFLIFLAAIWIIHEAIGKIRHPEEMKMLSWGVAVMLVSVVVNLAVSRLLFRVGRETDSMALQADAWHLRTDVWTSLGVLVALAAVWLGRLLLPGAYLGWLDPVAAIVVAMLIVRAAYRLTLQAAHDLMDASLPAEEEAWIRDCAAQLHPIVRGFHGLRTRKAGAVRFVEFHLIVGGGMSVEESHRIGETFAGEIEDHLPGSSVTVHIEPCDGTCEPSCVSGCLLSEREQRAAKLASARRR